MKTIIISSNCSGGGKTTVTLGLMKAFKERGLEVQAYKVGPDYIDTGFHKEITGKESRNLDSFLMGEDGVKAAFSRGAGDIGIIEGVMGLYDGKGLDESYSTYSISKLLGDIPIVLVITPKAQSLTLCAELNGIKNFKDANIAGVILNNITEKYYILLKKLIEENCDIDILGYLPKNEKLKLESRHLGLVQSVEVSDINEKINLCKDLLEENVDLDLLFNKCTDVLKYKDNFHVKNRNIKIGIAYDEAFWFYYKENLELLKEIGEIIYFSPLRDKELPKDIDFLYIGGGYPEVYRERLSENKSMLDSIKKELENGLSCYAECGGLMYLTEEIEGSKMVGFFRGNSKMTNRLNNFGYASLSYLNEEINVHEFHKSIVNLEEEQVYELNKVSVYGELKKWKCGYKKNNTIAGYPHMHFFGNKKFLDLIIKKEDEK